VTASMFAVPLIVTVLAIPLLGEKVGLHRWAAVLVGLGGVLLVVRPGGDMPVEALLPVGAAFMVSLYLIATRRMRTGADHDVMILYMTATGVVVSSLVAPLFWQTPALWQAGFIAFLGTLHGLGHLFLTRAFILAEASRITPFTYMQIIVAGGVAYALYGELPDTLGLVGAAVIILSGLYIWRRERVLARRVAIG